MECESSAVNWLRSLAPPHAGDGASDLDDATPTMRMMHLALSQRPHDLPPSPPNYGQHCLCCEICEMFLPEKRQPVLDYDLALLLYTPENSVWSTQQTSSGPMIRIHHPQAKVMAKAAAKAVKHSGVQASSVGGGCIWSSATLYVIPEAGKELENVQCLEISTSQTLVLRRGTHSVSGVNEGLANHKARMASFVEADESHQWLRWPK